MDKIELMSIDNMISWLAVLNNGYAKPDLSHNSSGSGTVNETKNFMPFIMLINKKLCQFSGIDCPDVEGFKNFRQTTI